MESHWQKTCQPTFSNSNQLHSDAFLQIFLVAHYRYFLFTRVERVNIYEDKDFSPNI